MERTARTDERPADAVAEADRKDEVVQAVLDRVLPATGGSLVEPRVIHCADHTNPLVEIHVRDRRLMVKRGPEPWSAERFRASARAARTIADHTDLVVPRYLDLPERVDGTPVLVWWRIERPTLGDVWNDLDGRQRRGALRSCGQMLRRLHRIRAHRWGPLDPDADPEQGNARDGAGSPEAVEGASVEGAHTDGCGAEGGCGAPERARMAGERGAEARLRGFLEQELAGRLRPTAKGVWREGVKLADALLERVRAVARRSGEPRLVHNDPHICNILCEVDGRDVRCVGLLDLEAAGGGPPEADLAYMRLVHSEDMAGRLGSEGWLEEVLEGYGRRPDPVLMRFFRVYHVLNIGIYCALKGSREEAAHLARIGTASLGEA